MADRRLHSKKSILFTTVAAFAALVASIGDFLMLSVAFGTLGTAPADQFTRLILWFGATLGALFIPLYFLGYLASALLLEHSGTRLKKILLVAGGSAAAFGSLTHALTAFEVDLVLALGIHVRAPAEIFAGATSPLRIAGLLAAVSVVTASASFCWASWRFSALPNRALWLLNPVFVTLTLVTIASPSKHLMAYLAPTAPNVAHFVFFLACGHAIATRRRRANAS